MPILTHVPNSVTTALNTALESYSQILSLISLQRATPNLPFPLISPGRSLLKRGSLIKVDRGSEIRNREFLLFTDCLIWMSRGGERESTYTPLPTLEPSTSAISEQSDPGVNAKGKNGPRRPFLARNRSRSETDMPQFKRAATSPVIPMPPPTAPISRSAMGFEPALDEKWWYRGRVQLMDVDVIVPTLPAGSDEKRRFELMSPESSFVLYAGEVHSILCNVHSFSYQFRTPRKRRREGCLGG